jgi:hypothetical protein
MSEITYAEAQTLVLARLNKWLNEMPVSERNMPRLMLYNPDTQKTQAYSVADLIVQVTRGTNVGKEYVYSQAKSLNYAIVS